VATFGPITSYVAERVLSPGNRLPNASFPLTMQTSCVPPHIAGETKHAITRKQGGLRTPLYQPRSDAMIPLVVLKRLAAILACAAFTSAPLLLA